MDKAKLWYEFSKLHPERWKLYNGYCLCELCHDYRRMFESWILTREPQATPASEPGTSPDRSRSLQAEPSL